jgi:hypothetical protein
MPTSGEGVCDWLNKRGSDDSSELKGRNFKQQQMLLLFVKLIEA